jgi:GT2 family glycosyltransferase
MGRSEELMAAHATDATDRNASSRTGIESAAWLTRDVMLLVARLDAPPDATFEARVSGDGAAGAHRCAGLRLDVDGRADRGSWLLALVAPGAGGDARRLAPIAVGTGSAWIELDEDTVGSALTDMKTLMRGWLAPLDGELRNRVTDFVARAIGENAANGRMRLSEALHDVREALRERLSTQVNSADKPRGLAVDRMLAVDCSSFYIQGWMRDEEAEIVRLTAVSPEGARCELLDRAFRYPRQDVEQFFSRQADEAGRPGFMCHFETGSPSLRLNGWVVEAENAEGVAIEVPAPRVIDNMHEVQDAILNDPFQRRWPNSELMAAHVHPALHRIQERVHDMIEIETVSEYGRRPEAPEVSIVVPIYKRIDHLEMQLAEFADDQQIQASELIYVLDSPEQGDALLDTAAQLYPIYRVPFRVVVLRRNVGFAEANNAGVSMATGKLLLLLNSDVLPAAPGWLGTMQEFYESKPDMGALGPKLLYEDDSIQHAGMYFYQPPGSSMWLDAHLFKGLHRKFEGANVARPVPAVSGACVMIDRELYNRLGFRGIYVRGDYEDFDLCLRLVEEGRENWYLPDAELYHLEAQSYSGDLRFPSNRYNMWLHTYLWGDRIPALMERYEYLAELTADD